MEIDHVFASGAVVGRATTHSWGRPAPRCARSDGRPHSCVVARPTTAPDAKTWSIPTPNHYLNWYQLLVKGLLSLGTNFSEIWINFIFFCQISYFYFNKMHLKMSSATWRPFCLCLNVLNSQLHPHSKVQVMITRWAAWGLKVTVFLRSILENNLEMRFSSAFLYIF